MMNHPGLQTSILAREYGGNSPNLSSINLQRAYSKRELLELCESKCDQSTCQRATFCQPVFPEDIKYIYWQQIRQFIMT